MRISVLIGAALALLAAGSSWAAPAQKQCTDEDRREGLRCPSIRERGQDDLPVPSGQEIGAFQQVCDAAHGFKTFSKQVGCIKGLISSSGAYGTQPEVTLYVLTADKLVEDVRSGRLRSAEARVELLEPGERIERRRRLAEHALRHGPQVQAFFFVGLGGDQRIERAQCLGEPMPLHELANGFKPRFRRRSHHAIVP